ncbi:hypothetical protein CGCF415_v001560 [Colletotrichum fructicola]|uniref:2EXR domain-containing protein n=1 Tax=Colletotrichum fructicola (strain Nara gc5) TaxID=1213859 RepID=L2G3I2_COLFN|nr:hypothetical protein CGCFRS4_v001017 [Colletotrichum fructicola]KAF4915446.1 hypothetical protein CGCF415_v001560 [Colletotrichum fructicola]KAF4940143.1 hypothetical protein CGCF245_v002922 [Colletotrichum fructicola]
MTKTFHSFSKLPAELRLSIWELAVRPTDPDHPGAHFFSVQRDIKTGKRFTTFPSFTQKSKPLWKEDNPSAYFYDFGMWTACKESRTVVIKQMGGRYKDLRRGKNRAVAHIRHGQEDITFGLLPRQGLLCIQLPDTENLDPYKDDPLSYLNIRMNWSVYWESNPDAIAFEYDESWAFDPEEDYIGAMMAEPGPRGAFLKLLDRAISDEFFGVHLFLIQYGSKCKPGVRKWETFHGNGFNLESVEYSGVELEDKSAMSAWDFICEITKKGGEFWYGAKDHWYSSGHVTPGEHVDVYADDHIDVLVCERA